MTEEMKELLNEITQRADEAYRNAQETEQAISSITWRLAKLQSLASEHPGVGPTECLP